MMGDMGQKTDTKCKITHFLMGLVHDYKRLTLFIKLKAAHAYARMWPVVVLVPGALVGLFAVSLPKVGVEVYPQHSFWHQPVPRGEKTRRMLPLWGFGKTET